jgi:hypothetical protein
MPAERQIHVECFRRELVQDIRRMRQHEGEPSRPRGGNATEIRTVQRRIVKPDDRQFACVHRQERDLVEQERDLATVELFGKFVHADPTVVVVVPERDEDRCESPEFRQKAKQMRQSVADVQEVAGDEDPIRPQFGYGADEGAVSGR